VAPRLFLDGSRERLGSSFEEAVHDRFLSSRTRTRAGASLGRVFSVVQQTWRITDDPRATKPKELALATGRTASDAADVARDAAGALRNCGFHKASGDWWASEDGDFHRFLIVRDRRAPVGPVVLGLGVAALALTAMVARRPGHSATKD
jgi:hypothetical protein